VTGAKAPHAVAFTRSGRLAVVVPRLPSGLAGGWADTVVSLPPGRWVDVLTGNQTDGGDVAAGSLLRRFPVAVLGTEG
jgi:(1->4)-alpha-D-glucan 1-alpha-D-glucosylmutase